MNPKRIIGAGHGPPTTAAGRGASRGNLDAWLEVDEAVVAVLVGDGATLSATDRRVVIVRDGAEYRPRSGVRSWPYDQVVGVELSRPRRGQARIVVRTGRYPWQAVSMFFSVSQSPEAERLVREVTRRVRTGRNRR